MNRPLPARQVFLSLLPREPKLWCTGLPEDQAWLRAQARESVIGAEEQDLRLANLGKEKWDGIWLDRRMDRYSLEDAQRILASCFQALKPKTGCLYLSYRPGQPEPSKREPPFLYPEKGIQSLLRQSGFQPVFEGPLEDSAWFARILKRV